MDNVPRLEKIAEVGTPLQHIIDRCMTTLPSERARLIILANKLGGFFSR